jgi:hypothetical protein
MRYFINYVRDVIMYYVRSGVDCSVSQNAEVRDVPRERTNSSIRSQEAFIVIKKSKCICIHFVSGPKTDG